MKVSYTLCLDGLSFFLFILPTFTGIFLMFFYRPETSAACNDIRNPHTSVTFGFLVRNMHRWAAPLMVLTVFVHMARVFYHGAYKPPREFNWVIGVILLTLTIGLSFTGYLLPWDQLALLAVTVGTNMPATPRFSARRSGSSSSADRRSAPRRCCAGTSCTCCSCRSSPSSSWPSTSGAYARTAESPAPSESLPHASLARSCRVIDHCSPVLRVIRSLGIARSSCLLGARWSAGLGGALFEFMIGGAADPRRDGSVVGVGGLADLGQRLGREPHRDELGQFRVLATGRPLR